MAFQCNTDAPPWCKKACLNLVVVIPNNIILEAAEIRILFLAVASL